MAHSDLLKRLWPVFHLYADNMPIGVLEYWSTGVMPVFFPLLQYSTLSLTPFFNSFPPSAAKGQR